jgi:hypothetical protein
VFLTMQQHPENKTNCFSDRKATFTDWNYSQ